MSIPVKLMLINELRCPHCNKIVSNAEKIISNAKEIAEDFHREPYYLRSYLLIECDNPNCSHYGKFFKVYLQAVITVSKIESCER